MRLALTAAAAVTPLRFIDDPVVLIEDGFIANVAVRNSFELPRDTRVIDFPDAVLAPGLIDIHIHGGAGFDVMSADAEGMAALGRHLARHGVTGYFPTTVTAPVDVTLASLSRLADEIESWDKHSENCVAAQPLGIHLEGPFISHVKRGVHPAQDIQSPSLELFAQMWEAARGHMRIMTIAPELPGACELIAEAAKHNVCVSLGHSDADYDCARGAMDAGARHATHTFNAMRALDHRSPGITAAVLTDARVSAEVICDGLHVAPAMVQLLLKLKGYGSAVLVTDAISATGMPDGRYRLGSFEVDVCGNRCTSSDGKLAGSVLTLDQAIRNVMEFAGCDLQDALRLATANPAHTAGLGLSRGALVPGARADVAVLTREGRVLKTLIGGTGV